MTDSVKTPLHEEEQTPIQPVETVEVVEETVAENVPEQGDDRKDVHSMTKNELVQTLRDIVAEKKVNAHREVTAIKQALFSLRQREINEELNVYLETNDDPAAFVSTPDPLEQEAKELQAAFRELRAEYLEAEEKRKAQNLTEKQKIVDEIGQLAEDIDNINMHFPKFQELQQAFKAIRDVPAESETEIWKNYQRVVELFYDRLNMNKELRALDFKKNLEIKRNLIEQVKALQELEDVVDADRRLTQLRGEWRETGPVSKELREEIWEEFNAVSAVVRKRHQEFFEARKAEEKANEDAKTKLCEEMEAIDVAELKSFTAWEEATEKVKDIQARWKELGFASRKANTALYSRFRAKCDEFFAAKSEYTKRTREDLQKNLAKKTELCEKAEALRDQDVDLKTALDTVVKLQAEWKTIGGVGKKYSDEIWKRFTEACNYFFDERKKQMADRRAEETSNLEVKRGIIAKLKELSPEGDRAEVLAKVRELQQEWQEAGHVPFKQKDRLYAEYREVCDSLYESLNASRASERRRRFENHVESIKGDESRVGKERDKMLRAIEQRRQELKTYENNLGFFNVKSSAGNSMVREMERKMQHLKDEIEEIQQKLNMLEE